MPSRFLLRFESAPSRYLRSALFFNYQIVVGKTAPRSPKS